LAFELNSVVGDFELPDAVLNFFAREKRMEVLELEGSIKVYV
jgi:hypothetical protein